MHIPLSEHMEMYAYTLLAVLEHHPPKKGVCVCVHMPVLSCALMVPAKKRNNYSFSTKGEEVLLSLRV